MNAGKDVRSGDVIFLKTRSGKGNHIDVEGVRVRARWQSQGQWQALTIEKENGGPVYSGDVIYLKAHSGNHIDIVNGSVQSRWSDFGLWQAMKIEKKMGSGAIAPNDVICLLSMNTGKHIDV